jgi:hypothetical protein
VLQLQLLLVLMAVQEHHWTQTFGSCGSVRPSVVHSCSQPHSPHLVLT